MDYLNYANKVQQKPQGFGQEKVQLTKDDFTFGDLNQQTPQPQVASQQKDELMQLFPTPILISLYPYDFSRELEWIRTREYRNRKSNDNIVSENITYNRQSEDTFILDNPEMSKIRSFIQLKLDEFARNILNSPSKLVITQSWTNCNGKNESHHEHKHPNSMISGVWYPQINEQLPPITFRRLEQRDIALQHDGFNLFNSASYMLPLKKGELILFPSSLSHSVPPNLSDEERISLSFNTWAKGNLGNEKSLTYLPFDRLM